MPCAHTEHDHEWPQEGLLVVEKCEHFCGYCEGDYAEHEWKFAWFLRRHVKTVHCKEGGDYPNVTVSDSWTGMPARKPRLARRPAKPHKTRRNTPKIKTEPQTTSPQKRLRLESSQISFKPMPVTPERVFTADMEKAIVQSTSSIDSSINSSVNFGIDTSIDFSISPSTSSSMDSSIYTSMDSSVDSNIGSYISTGIMRSIESDNFNDATLSSAGIMRSITDEIEDMTMISVKQAFADSIRDLAVQGMNARISAHEVAIMLEHESRVILADMESTILEEESMRIFADIE